MSNTPTSSAQVAEGMNLEAERAAPCPFCESSHVNVCKNNRGRKFVICNQCKTSGPVVSINCEDVSAIAVWNRRTAAQVAEGGALPPLAGNLRHLATLLGIFHGGDDEYVLRHANTTLDQVVREVKALKAWVDELGHVWDRPVQARIDTLEFSALIGKLLLGAGDLDDDSTYKEAKTNLIKHIDSLIAPYAERIRLLEQDNGLLSIIADQFKARLASADARIEELERDLATFKGEHATQLATIESREFRKLLDAWGSAAWGEYDDGDVGQAYAALIAYIDARTAGPAWISVDDARKPVAGKPILLFVRTLTRGEDDDGRPYETEGAQVETGEYRLNNGNPYFDCYVSPMSDNDWVTHWMPLPAAPKPQEDA